MSRDDDGIATAASLSRRAAATSHSPFHCCLTCSCKTATSLLLDEDNDNNIQQPKNSPRIIPTKPLTITMFNLFLQLCLAALCSAAPITAQDATTQYGAGGGVIGFIVLVLDILVWSRSYSCTLRTRDMLTSPLQSRFSSRPAPSATSSCGLSLSSSSLSAVSSSTGSFPTARSGTTETATRLLLRRRGRRI